MSAPSNIVQELNCPICRESLKWSGSYWLHSDGSGVDSLGNYICTKFDESVMFGEKP